MWSGCFVVLNPGCDLRTNGKALTINGILAPPPRNADLISFGRRGSVLLYYNCIFWIETQMVSVSRRSVEG